MIFTTIITAVTVLSGSVVMGQERATFNTLFSEIFESQLGEEKGSIPDDEFGITSNLIDVPDKANFRWKFYRSIAGEKDYSICFYVKGMKKPPEVYVNLKFEAMEDFNDKGTEDNCISVPKVTTKITSLTIPFTTRSRPDLLSKSTLGLGSGILGIGAIDLGHGLGRFGLR